MKREIKNCLTWLANQIALDYIYGDKFHSNKEIMEKFYDSIKNEIEWNTMTTQQAKELRFARWSDDMPNLWLIPIWLYPVIPDDLPLICINGKKPIRQRESILTFVSDAWHMVLKSRRKKSEIQEVC